MFRKGNTPWNKNKNIQLNSGRTHFKKGQVSFRKGIKQTEEAKEKNRQAHLGKKISEETRKKLRECHKGEKSYQWKGGISKNYKRGYKTSEYKKWRLSIFERDGFKCQVCGIIGVYITAHHIKSFAKYPELRYEISNGITLCEECHKLTDNYNGKTNK